MTTTRHVEEPLKPSHMPTSSMQNKVDSLDGILKEIEDTAVQKRSLEQQHAQAIVQLQEKQAAVGTLADRHKTDGESVETLQSKVREYEKKAELQNVRHEELLLEMAALKKSRVSSAWAQHNRITAFGHEQLSPESPSSTPGFSSFGGVSPHPFSPSPPMSPTTRTARPHSYNRWSSRPTAGLIGGGWAGSGSGSGSESLRRCNSLADFHAELTRPPPGNTFVIGGHTSCTVASLLHPTATNSSSYIRNLTSSAPVSASTTANHYQMGPSNNYHMSSTTANNYQMGSSAPGSLVSHMPNRIPDGKILESSSTEIDKIMARIEQDNKILAELDRTRSTLAGMIREPTLNSTIMTNPIHQPNSIIDTSCYTSGFGGNSLPPNIAAMATQQQIQASMAGIPMGMTQMGPQSIQQYQHQGVPTAGLTLPALPIGQQAFMPIHYGTLQQGVMPQMMNMNTQEAQSNFLNANMPGMAPLNNIGVMQMQDNRMPDMLDIPGKGRCSVYIARYSYDPFRQSPNENPEAELYLNAGDYVLIWGEMDEDGFLDGELLDGRRGLIPSNYVQRLRGEDLLEFHQTVVLGLRDCEDVISTTIPQDLFNCVDETSAMMMMAELRERELEQQYSYLDIEDDDDEYERHQSEVPAPRQLTLERQLNKSILIGWNAAECPPGTIESYHVYVDGQLKCTMRAGERTRALVEGVDSHRPHRISVRAVTPNRRASRDAACTMVIGKDAPLAPSCVRATQVNNSSATISWLPANSNFQHVVCVNNVEVRTVKPGVYRHIITGLAPNTTYWVTIRAKNIKSPHFDETSSQQIDRLATHIEFRTLSKGLPDPPVDVQVEQGPQDGTLLVTWLPVSTNVQTQQINGAFSVTGYAVFADGRKVSEVDSPTGDHALIQVGRMGTMPRQVTVRTKSRDTLSADSTPASVPIGQNRRIKDDPAMRRRGHHNVMLSEQEESFSDKEMLPTRSRIPTIEITKEMAGNDMDRRMMGRNPRDRPHHGHPPSHQPMGPNNPNMDPQGYDRGRERDRERAMRDRNMQQGMVPPSGPVRDGFYDDRRGHHRTDDFRERNSNSYGGRGGGEMGVHRGFDRMGGVRGDRERERERPRIFVALFNYDPQSMSPNPDACEEELPFHEGQLIKIYGDKDADGFYWGEAAGHRGFVPCNMVSEVQVDDERAAQELLKSGESGRDRWGDTYANMAVKKMVALYDYDPQELSPNVDAEQVELSFRTGDVIYVYGEMDEDGFFMGELNGSRGLVPSNFLAEVPPDYERSRQQHLGPHDRRGAPGPGPGARGPPPPPRDHRDRRRAACPYPVDPTQGEAGRRNEVGIDGRRGEHLSRRDQGPGDQQGRGRGESGQDMMNNLANGQGPAPAAPALSAITSARRMNPRIQKGIPAVIPEPIEPDDPVQEPVAPPPQAKSSFFEGLTSGVAANVGSLNLGQKLTEATGGEGLLSKGKELIFKKFGL